LFPLILQTLSFGFVSSRPYVFCVFLTFLFSPWSFSF
jgi:hypothetical protein